MRVRDKYYCASHVKEPTELASQPRIAGTNSASGSNTGDRHYGGCVLFQVSQPVRGWEGGAPERCRVRIHRGVRCEIQLPVVQARADCVPLLASTRRFSSEPNCLDRTKNIRFEDEIYRLPEMKLLATGHAVLVLMRKGNSIRSQTSWRRSSLRLGGARRAPFIEPLPALPPRHPCSHHLPQQWAWPILRVLKLVHEHLCDVEGGVEPHVVK